LESITVPPPKPGRTGLKPCSCPSATRKWSKRTKRVKLRALCYARSGDKGDMCNIGVLARSQDIYCWLLDFLKPKVVKSFFRGTVHGPVKRYELSCFQGLNFTMDKALGGGGTVSLMLDPQGKTLSQALLEMEVDAPVSIIPKH
jgi:hypothetical protein